MHHAKPLPRFLVQRYKGWKATQFEENKSWYSRLADEGQRPRTMIISCCDSRVHVTSIFGADSGEFFIHRNIANLVPPFEVSKTIHGTSAAIEYAVTALKVSNLVVLGHSKCGGVQGCYEMCTGEAPQLQEASSFVGRWMDILKPGFERIEKNEGDKQAKLTALEHESILVSLENLMTFPFVKEAVESGQLSLHGLWHEIGSGSLECYDADKKEFTRV
ncbi:carbonic anhydrase [Oceanomicrobium pacificus]|uniref:Carbonic anhydrase n=1 Tax=Oceanomicrobium pacificus TaxID=2692916 RepID=A0A6B0TJF3_9RHOB|nr:carbonic anhydrase [Oceanomicrobium pacificus]MXU64590.1 carbonic anhydrase [Oceanomicrobium pacificus]